MATAGSLSIDSSPLSLRYKARLAVRAPRQSRTREHLRRVLNVVAACVGLVVTAPLMLVIAIAVRVTSPGPIIFRQQRVGLDRRRDRGEFDVNRRRTSDLGGNIFTMYKFRTMTVEEKPSEVWATAADPRVTSIGRFLRATRLDELPQFVNVLKGDMNIVGPRPEQPGIFDELRGEIGRYQDRQRVLPGITGLAQVKRGYDTDLSGVRSKVRLDLEYIRRRSAREDLMIMLKTVPVMIFRKVWM